MKLSLLPSYLGDKIKHIENLISNRFKIPRYGYYIILLTFIKVAYSIVFAVLMGKRLDQVCNKDLAQWTIIQVSVNAGWLMFMFFFTIFFWDIEGFADWAFSTASWRYEMRSRAGGDIKCWLPPRSGFINSDERQSKRNSNLKDFDTDFSWLDKEDLERPEYKIVRDDMLLQRKMKNNYWENRGWHSAEPSYRWNNDEIFKVGVVMFASVMSVLVILFHLAWLIYGTYLVSQSGLDSCQHSVYKIGLATVIVEWVYMTGMLITITASLLDI